jgi:1,2-dihydroxy-3-keto-5-methylthiopentene dioxygenase
MTMLTIWSEDKPERAEAQATAPSEIANHLAALDVRFERWPLRPLPPDANPSGMLAIYKADIERLKAAAGYTTADVVSIRKGTPDTEPLRAKFLDEHTHAEDEVRFFVEGSGAFYLRGQGRVYQVICTAGDLLSVPARTRHWFDMGPAPHFTAIRLFTDPEGWVADFTGDAIARRFPLLEPAV